MRAVLLRCLFLVSCILLLPLPAHADTTFSVTGSWYVKDFRSEITVNQDSSLSVTEYITADCEQCSNAHGIFRVLPLGNSLTADTFHRTPVALTSITNFQDTPYKYTESVNKTQHTITWKIGDPNRTVSGVNEYKLRYTVKNAILQGNAQFDELYWNLPGNFWDIPIAAYQATVTFPPPVQASEAAVTLYSGAEKATGNSLAATSSWSQPNQVTVTATQVLQPQEGITLSVTTPKNIFAAYQLTAAENSLYDTYHPSQLVTNVVNVFGVLLPLGIFWVFRRLWQRFGKDPKAQHPIVPEYDVPGQLCPLELSLVERNGSLDQRAITASIIDLAVKGYLRIEKMEKQGIFGQTDYLFEQLKAVDKDVPVAEAKVFSALFGGQAKVLASSLRNHFYLQAGSIAKEVSNDLEAQQVLDLTGKKIQEIGLVATLILFPFLAFGSIALAVVFNAPLLAVGCIVSGIIMIVYLALMSRRTPLGVELYRQIQGYQLYLKTAEKYRAQFYEKENIFEKYLPYAILFGLTTQWINALRHFYGEEYFATYAPVWLTGSGLGAGMGVTGLTEAMTSISSQIGSTIMSSPSSSGAGGGGFSGGGGGGGGGGGW